MQINNYEPAIILCKYACVYTHVNNEKLFNCNEIDAWWNANWHNQCATGAPVSNGSCSGVTVANTCATV